MKSIFNPVDTEVLTLEKIEQGEYQFIIPSYQRPYVWPDEDVLKLFDDICEAHRLGDSNYFIGTVLTSKGKDTEGNDLFELIDGQQRTTTLMLIALSFKMTGTDLKLANLAVFNNKPRLQFAIREQVQHLLGSLAGLSEKYTTPGREAIKENDYLTRIDAALTVLKQRVNKLSEEERLILGEFIYSKVQWVNNIVPINMDLNRLFATMNTAGIQLEQADILKAKLLKQVKSDKATYDAIWVACEHLENYFERNVRKVFPNADWNAIKPKHLRQFKPELFAELEGDIDNKATIGLSLTQLYQQAQTESELPNAKRDEFDTYEAKVKTIYCRSIITFPLLLIHAYRIYAALNNKDDIKQRLRLHADRLLEIFEPMSEASEEDVKAFMQVLWQVRYQFDRWIVKWVESDDSSDEKLLLAKPRYNNSDGRIGRTPERVGNLVQLQSVRNFTGERSAQYWLTSFIAGLILNDIKDEAPALGLLEQLDNELSLTAENETQKSASFKQAKGQKPDMVKAFVPLMYLREVNGTRFEHYWFQKLEYLLWKNADKSTDSKLKKYRITSRNSVEHVHPQQEEHQRQLPIELLDSFGNLVLLSPSENSSYSNQSVNKKKADFEDKPHYDSLKLRAMFRRMDDEGKGWNERSIKRHLREMLAVLRKHYRKAKHQDEES